MTKLKFLLELQKQLDCLPQQDVEEQLTFYCEMIEDRVEDGAPEEEAVAQIGSVEEISSLILAEHAAEKTTEEEITDVLEELTFKKGNANRKYKTWEIVLFAVGSPIWFTLFVAAFAVGFSLYVSLWAVIISIWAVFGSLVACAAALPVGGAFVLFRGYPMSGLAVFAASLVCAGLAIFLYYGCKYATKGAVYLTKIMLLAMKNCFIRKERE